MSRTSFRDSSPGPTRSSSFPDSKIERGLTRPFLLTGELSAYTTPQPVARILFPYEIVNGKAELMTAETLERKYPRGWAYLCEHRETLRQRERGKWKHDRWYAFGRSQNLVQMDADKLIIQVTAQRPTVMLDTTGLYMTGGGSGPFYGIRPKTAGFPIKYLLALMNSAQFGDIIAAQSTNLRGGYIKFSKQYIETAPVIPPEEAGPEKVRQLIALVDQLIALRQQLASPGSPHETENRKNQLTALTATLDTAVAELYGVATIN